MERQALSLWTVAAAESMFLYYFIGSLALIFFITVFITKALRRKKSQVIELMENDDFKERTVAYLVSITTSLRLGAGCPNYVKVFMQLIGDRNVSPYFTLRADKVRPLLKRGFTDIFLVKVKESIGRICSIKLVVSGEEGCLRWRISQVQLYNPRTNIKRQPPVTIVSSETLDKTELEEVMLQSKSPCDSCVSVILYHQWLSRIGNTVRFGAFSDIVYVLVLFLTILTLLIFSFIFYVVLPKPAVDTETFSLNLTSFVVASSSSALACFIICLTIEVLMRKIRSREKNLNYAYYNLKHIRRSKRLPHQVRQFQFGMDRKYEKLEAANNIGDFEDESECKECKLYVLKQIVCDKTFRQTKGKTELQKPLFHNITQTNDTNMPPYIHNLADALATHHGHKHADEDELDRKLSLAIINSATTGLNQLVQKNLITDEMGVDAKTGEHVTKKKREPKMKKRDVKKGMGSRTSLSKQVPLEASQSKYFVDIQEKMSDHLVKVFGGPGKIKEDLARKKPSDNEKMTNLPEKAKGAKKKVVNDKKGRRDVKAGKFKEVSDRNVNAEKGGTDEKAGKFKKVVAGIMIERVMTRSDYAKFGESLQSYKPSSKQGKQREDEKSGRTSLSDVKLVDRHGTEISRKWVPDMAKFTTSARHLKERKTCEEIEGSIKRWARGFVQDLLVKFRAYRDSAVEGYLTFQMTWFEMLDLVHEVLFKITSCMVYKMKQDLLLQETLQTQPIQNFISHASCEVILLATDGVSSYLQNEGKNSLADLLLLSHTVMQGIRHVTDALIYCLENIDAGEENRMLQIMLSQLDTQADLKYVSVKFLQACATWTFQQGSISWPFIRKLIPTEDKDISDPYDKISSLVALTAGDVEKYKDMDFISAKLAQVVIEESQEEIWCEYQNEQLIFTNILVKLRMLSLFRKKIRVLEKKKRFLDKLIDEHDKPKSRIQKRMEKRLESEKTEEEQIEEREEEEKKKSSIKDPWQREMVEMEYKDWIREVGILIRPLVVLSKIKLYLEKWWKKQGLQLNMRAEKHLAQALLQPNLAQAKDDPNGFWFENFLHFKRAEAILGRYLIISADHLVKLIAYGPVQAALQYRNSVEQVVEDIVTKVDIGIEVLLEDEGYILHEVMGLEIMKEKAIDNEIEIKLSQQFPVECPTGKEKIRKPASHVRFSKTAKTAGAGAEDWYIETERERRVRDLAYERGLMGRPGMTDSEVDMLVIDINQSAGADKQPSNITSSKDKIAEANKAWSINETVKDEDFIQSMISVLKPVKTYMAFIRKEEILHNQFTLQHYLKKSQRKRQRACALNYQRLLDSYFMIEEDDNNPSHTKESLYQLEHDFMRESDKPLPRVLKTVLIWIMVIMILVSFVYIGLVAGQLSTTETQEWICYYLLSLAVFMFVLEPIRAILVGCLVKSDNY